MAPSGITTLLGMVEPWVLFAGALAVAAGLVGQTAVLWMILTQQPGVWVLYASAAFGVLGFVGAGTILTGFLDR